MSRFWKLLVGAVVPAVLMSMLVGTGPASAVGVAHNGVVSATPFANTPHVLDNKVFDFAQVGNRIVVAGSFLQIRNAPANGGATFSQRGIFAFDPATGAIDRAFSPVINGNINALIPGPNGTVYAGGTFTTVNGATGNRNLVQLSVATGQRTAFRAPAMNGAVNDLAIAGGRLYVGGAFTTVANTPHGGLATLNPTTGAIDQYMGVDVTVNHNWEEGAVDVARTPVGVDRFDITPDGSRLVAMGNFTFADGETRDQMVIVLLQAGGAVVDPNWRTQRYEPDCYAWAFDHYTRDIQISPDGTYFAVVTSGGGNPGTLCDTVARWDFADTGDDVQPRWADYSGGDSLFSVEVTGTAIYVGGHQRWMNNPFGQDSNGSGSVPRPGISAHDPRTGTVLGWNPGRNPRGVGAEAMMATATGLYVGMDTDYFGNRQFLRPGLGYFPLAGGAALPSEATATLPARVNLGGPLPAGGGGGATGNVLYRVNAGGPALASLDAGPAWSEDDGSFHTEGNNAAYWGPVSPPDGSVPSTTPPEVFDTELWSPSDDPAMEWDFPVPADQGVEVRLYFANGYDGTADPGTRVFDVSIDGVLVLADYDISADVGHRTGTMKSFTVTSDGTVDIDFRHVVENPLINGIEIVETGGTTPTPTGSDDILARWFDGTDATGEVVVDRGGLEWSKARGAFMAAGFLYYGYPDDAGVYGLYRRTFDGTTFGSATLVDPYNDPRWSDVSTGSGDTYRGARPSFYSQLATVSGMFYSAGRIYYTRTGLQPLYSRPFSLDSGVVGWTESRAAETGFSAVAGMFLSGTQLYTADRVTGDLSQRPFAGGVPGAPVPADSGLDWTARALFIGPGNPPPGANQPPTANFTSSCTGLTCQFTDTSTDDTGVTGWSWTYEGGGSSTQRNPSHTFAAAGSYDVTLTVTDGNGATDPVTLEVTVSAPPAGGIAYRGASFIGRQGVSAVTVNVPPTVQTGDGLVLVLSIANPRTVATPAGWTLAGQQTSGTGPMTLVYERVAAAGDAGDPATVTWTGGNAKATLQLVAYDGTNAGAGGPVGTVVSAARAAGTSHTTPGATATANAWVLSVWSDKQNAARTWTTGGATERTDVSAPGTGAVATMLADSNGPVAAGPVAGVTATVPTPSNRATVFTIVLTAG
jgi:PKD repeat protein